MTEGRVFAAIGRRRRRAGFARAALVALAFSFGAVAPAHAQQFTTGELAGTWQLFQLTTPSTAGNGGDIRAYRGQVTFDASGHVSDVSPVTDDQANAFLASGNFSVSTIGVVTGKLTLSGTSGAPTGDLTLREARLLVDRHTLVGAAAVFDQGGLFTLVKVEDAQVFGLADIGGAIARDWSYSELTPANDLAPFSLPAWVSGSITFHGTNGCTDADLKLPDGTVRSSRTGTPGDPFG